MKKTRDDLQRAVDGERAFSAKPVTPVMGSPPQTPRNSPTTRGIPRTPEIPATQADPSSPESVAEPLPEAAAKDGLDYSPTIQESPLRAIPRDGWGQGFTPESCESPVANVDGYGTPSPQNKA